MNILIAKNTQIEMIADRGYYVPEEEIAALNNNDNMKKLKKLTLTQSYHNDDESIYVFYITEDEDLSKQLEEFKKKMKKHTYGIIISDVNNIKKMQKKNYAGYFDPLKTIQLFSFDDLQYNVSQTIYNGSYQKVAKSLVVPTICHIDELNILFLNDPIVKYYGFQGGDIIKVIEDTDVDVINNKSTTYCVVKNEYIDF
jgi:hypothetical protein